MARSVFLRGIPDLPALQDEVTAYFESHRQWRGKVREVRLLGPGQAIVTFADRCVAQSVLSFPEHRFHGVSVKIEPCPHYLVTTYGNSQAEMTEETGFTSHEAGTEEMVSGEVDIGEGLAEYLHTYRADDITELERRLSPESVEITNTKTGFSIQGTGNGVSDAKEDLEHMASRDIKTGVLVLPLTEPGIHGFIAKEKAEGQIRAIEQDRQCVISVDETCLLRLVENDDISAFSTPQPSHDEDKCELRIGGVTLLVKLGNLTTETAGAIVVPTSNVLDHSKGLARTVYKAAGHSVLEQCREYVKTEGSPHSGDIVVVEGGRLPCGPILYLTCPDARQLRSDVRKCLCLADDLGVWSAAFPAIGTGGFGIKPERCARRMIDGIINFAQNHREHKLSLVKIVVYQDKIMETFRTEIIERITGSTSRGRSTSESDSYPNEVLLHIFGPDETSVEQAKKKVQEIMDNYSTHEIIVDSAVKQLSTEERKMLQVYGRRERVMITIDEEHNGCYHIEGSCDVRAAGAVVRRFLADRSANRSTRREILGLRLFQWYYVLPSGECRPFGTENNDRIEEIYAESQPTAYCVTGGELCLVDLHNKTMTVQSSGATFDILREDLARNTGVVPETWDPQPYDRNSNRPKVCHIVTLSPVSPEYRMVQSKFLSGVGRARIVSIERVQSPALWEQYSVMRRTISSRNSMTSIEKELWHGTTAEACREISPNGFNRRYSGQHGTVYGKGTYFAVNASYSAHDTYSKPDSRGWKKMYLAKVLTGKYTKGSRSMAVPPRRQDSPELPYDSTVDDKRNPSTFVVFHDAQAYPQYLITFKMVPK